MLTERTRYRLTGSVFLIAVAAITIPMLFDGEGVAPMELDPLPEANFEVERNAPPMPDVAPALEARRQLKEAIDEDGFARDTGTRIGEPALIAEPAPTSAAEEPAEDRKWAVQVGAFANPDNATARRDELLADGYAAFLSSAKRQGEVSTRVGVGPFISRDDALRLKAELDKRYEIAAVVVGFSP